MGNLFNEGRQKVVNDIYSTKKTDSAHKKVYYGQNDVAFVIESSMVIISLANEFWNSKSLKLLNLITRSHLEQLGRGLKCKILEIRAQPDAKTCISKIS